MPAPVVSLDHSLFVLGKIPPDLVFLSQRLPLPRAERIPPLSLIFPISLDVRFMPSVLQCPSASFPMFGMSRQGDEDEGDQDQEYRYAIHFLPPLGLEFGVPFLMLP